MLLEGFQVLSSNQQIPNSQHRKYNTYTKKHLNNSLQVAVEFQENVTTLETNRYHKRKKTAKMNIDKVSEPFRKKQILKIYMYKLSVLQHDIFITR